MNPSYDFTQLPLKSLVYLSSGPKKSPPQRCVIFLHGLGASGDNLIDISYAWEKDLPHTLFLSPHAPFDYGDEQSDHRCRAHTGNTPIHPHQGFQWFPPTQDYETLLPVYADKALTHLSAYIDSVVKLTHLKTSDIALVGFSQGGMMALQYALYGSHPIAGAISFSGAQISHRPPLHKTPVCLIHGKTDEVLPPSYFKAAEAFMKHHHVPYESFLLPDLDHSINKEGLSLGENFLKSVFSL